MSSRTGRRFHFWLLAAWVVIGLPVSFVLRQSVPWVVFLSVYAIIATHWAGWSAERPNEVEDTGQRDKRQRAFGNLNSTNVQAETHPAE